MIKQVRGKLSLKFGVSHLSIYMTHIFDNDKVCVFFFFNIYFIILSCLIPNCITNKGIIAPGNSNTLGRIKLKLGQETSLEQLVMCVVDCFVVMINGHTCE